MAKFTKINNVYGKCVDGKHAGCGSVWRLRVDNPIQCPRCHSPFENSKKITKR